LVLDCIEELYMIKERMIEMSIEKDHLVDSVSDLVNQLYESRKSYRKLQKQFNQLKKLHENCKKRNVILYQ
jgi:hypothetical protein